MGRAKNQQQATATRHFDAVMGRARGRGQENSVFSIDTRSRLLAMEQFQADIAAGNLADILNVRVRELPLPPGGWSRAELDQWQQTGVLLRQKLWQETMESPAAQAARDSAREHFPLLLRQLPDGNDAPDPHGIYRRLGEQPDLTPDETVQAARSEFLREYVRRLDFKLAEGADTINWETCKQLMPATPWQSELLLEGSGWEPDSVLDEMNVADWQELLGHVLWEPAQTEAALSDEILGNRYRTAARVLGPTLDRYLNETVRPRLPQFVQDNLERERELRRLPTWQSYDIIRKRVQQLNRGDESFALDRNAYLSRDVVARLQRCPQEDELPFNSKLLPSLKSFKDACRHLNLNPHVLYLAAATAELPNCNRDISGQLTGSRYTSMKQCVRKLQRDRGPISPLEAIDEQLHETGRVVPGQDWRAPYRQLLAWYRDEEHI